MNKMFVIGFSIWALVGAAFYGAKIFKPPPAPVVRGPMPTKKKVTAKTARRFKTPDSKKAAVPESGSQKGLYSNLQRKVAKVREYHQQRLGQPESMPTQTAQPQLAVAPSNSAQETKPLMGNRRNDAYNPRAHRYEGAPSVHNSRGEELLSARTQYIEAQERAWSKDELMTAFNQIYQYVMQQGGSYNTAFSSLTRDVQISSTPEPLKAELLSLIRQEEKGYRDYFQGGR